MSASPVFLWHSYYVCAFTDRCQIMFKMRCVFLYVTFYKIVKKNSHDALNKFSKLVGLFRDKIYLRCLMFMLNLYIGKFLWLLSFWRKKNRCFITGIFLGETDAYEINTLWVHDEYNAYVYMIYSTKVKSDAYINSEIYIVSNNTLISSIFNDLINVRMSWNVRPIYYNTNNILQWIHY